MARVIEYLLYAFIFLIPWNTRMVLRAGELNGGPSTGSGQEYWEYGSISLYATDILFLVILILSVFWLWRQTPSPSPFQRGSRWGLVFIAYILLSILWSSNSGVAAYAAIRLLQGIVLFVLVRALPLNRAYLVYALVVGAVIQSVLAIIQFSMQEVVAWPFTGMSPQDPSTPGVAVVEAAGRRWLRAYGSFPHPNLLGAYFAMTLLALLEVVQSPITKIQTNSKFQIPNSKLFFAIISTFLAIGLFLTFSRAAWLALAVGIAIWFIQHRAWRSRAVQIGGAAVGVIVILYSALFWPLIASRVTGIGRLELKSTSERIQYVRESVALIRDHALVGVGIGNYTAAVHNELRPNDPAWSYQPVHNAYLLVLAELGIVGALLFLYVVGSFLTPYPLLLIPLSILLFFDHSFWTLHSGILLLWVMLRMQNNGEKGSGTFYPQQVLTNKVYTHLQYATSPTREQRPYNLSRHQSCECTIADFLNPR